MTVMTLNNQQQQAPPMPVMSGILMAALPDTWLGVSRVGELAKVVNTLQHSVAAPLCQIPGSVSACSGWVR